MICIRFRKVPEVTFERPTAAGMGAAEVTLVTPWGLRWRLVLSLEVTLDRAVHQELHNNKLECFVCSRAAEKETEIRQIEQTGEWRIHPLLDQGADVFPRDVGDGLEEAVSGHQHLTPHLTLVFLGWGCAGQTQKLVKNLVGGRKSPFKMMDGWMEVLIGGGEWRVTCSMNSMLILFSISLITRWALHWNIL